MSQPRKHLTRPRQHSVLIRLLPSLTQCIRITELLHQNRNAIKARLLQVQEQDLRSEHIKIRLKQVPFKVVLSVVGNILNRLRANSPERLERVSLHRYVENQRHLAVLDAGVQNSLLIVKQVFKLIHVHKVKRALQDGQYLFEMPDQSRQELQAGQKQGLPALANVRHPHLELPQLILEGLYQLVQPAGKTRVEYREPIEIHLFNVRQA